MSEQYHSILGLGVAGTELTDQERRVLDEVSPISVILFSRNIESADQLQALIGEIHSHGRGAPLVVIDEEGGRVDRLRDLIPGIPGAQDIAKVAAAEELAGRLGEQIGRALRSLGIDVNLAPVVDVERDEPVKGLERRTWGKDAERVTTLAAAFMRGQHRSGVASCLKHFPGLGAGSGDPHYGASLVEASVEELERIDLAPYKSLAAEAQAVMIGHSVYPAVEDPALPASLSRRISTGLLREVLGFDGVALSDDMEMHAVSDLGTFEEIGERALMAGSDIVYFCSQIERAGTIAAHFARRLDDPRFEVRHAQARARAEAFREHCEELQARSAMGTFEAARDGFAAFCEEFREICESEGKGLPYEGRAGTGRTGREEWT